MHVILDTTTYTDRKKFESRVIQCITSLHRHILKKLWISSQPERTRRRHLPWGVDTVFHTFTDLHEYL